MPESPSYFHNRLIEEVYGACLSYESKRAAASPAVKLDPEMLAHKCDRALWFCLSGQKREIADGRLARQLERKRIVRQLVTRDLRRAGFRVQWSGRLNCGYIHGITRRPHLLEIVTVQESVYRLLNKFGISGAPDLETAMHCRMGYARIDKALFVAENNNTQELYFQRVEFDSEIFSQVRAHVGQVMESEAPPAGIYDEECILCGYRTNCREVLEVDNDQAADDR